MLQYSTVSIVLNLHFQNQNTGDFYMSRICIYIYYTTTDGLRCLTTGTMKQCFIPGHTCEWHDATDLYVAETHKNKHSNALTWKKKTSSK